MANISKILQSAKSLAKIVANSKTVKTSGKVINTIFAPVKKAHCLQGFNAPAGSKASKFYDIGLISTVGIVAGDVAYLGVQTFKANKAYEKKRLY